MTNFWYLEKWDFLAHPNVKMGKNGNAPIYRRGFHVFFQKFMTLIHTSQTGYYGFSLLWVYFENPGKTFVTQQRPWCDGWELPLFWWSTGHLDSVDRKLLANCVQWIVSTLVTLLTPVSRWNIISCNKVITVHSCFPPHFSLPKC